MELHEAVKIVVDQFGEDIITERRFLYMLADYYSFKDKPAAKPILRDLINSGVTNKICNLDTKTPDWQMKFIRYQHDFIEAFGYKEDLVIYVFESIAYGLGMEIVNCHHFHSANDSNKEDISKCKETQNISAIRNEVSIPRERKPQYIKPKFLVSKDGLKTYVKHTLAVGVSTQIKSTIRFLSFNSIEPEFRQLQEIGIVSTEHMDILTPSDYHSAKLFSVLVRDFDEIMKIIDDYFDSGANKVNFKTTQLTKENMFKDVEPKWLVSKDDLVSFVHHYLLTKSSVRASIDGSYRMYKSTFKQLQKMGIISKSRVGNNYSILVRDFNEILRIIDDYYLDYKEWR